jgi:PadR family transcriptional regulator, regulatory protein PadR
MISRGQAGDRTNIRRALVVFAVLAVLRKGPSHGYEMSQKLRQAHELVACESDLYPLLLRLGRQGLIRHTWELSPAGPPRKRYELTDAGERSLKERQNLWKELRQAMLRLLEVDGETTGESPTPSRD